MLLISFAFLSVIYLWNGDGNEDGKKEIGLDWQNNSLARASRFLVHFFAVVIRLRRETSYFGGWQHMTTIFFFFCKVSYNPLEFNSLKKSPSYDKLEEFE